MTDAQKRANRNVTLLLLHTVCVNMIFILPVLVPYYRDVIGIGFREFMIGEAAFSAVMILMEVPTGWLSDVWGRKKTMVVSTVTGLAGWGLLWHADSFAEAVIAQASLGVAVSLLLGTNSALLYDSLLGAGREGEYRALEGRRHGQRFRSSPGRQAEQYRRDQNADALDGCRCRSGESVPRIWRRSFVAVGIVCLRHGISAGAGRHQQARFIGAPGDDFVSGKSFRAYFFDSADAFDRACCRFVRHPRSPHLAGCFDGRWRDGGHSDNKNAEQTGDRQFRRLIISPFYAAGTGAPGKFPAPAPFRRKSAILPAQGSGRGYPGVPRLPRRTAPRRRPGRRSFPASPC